MKKNHTPWLWSQFAIGGQIIAVIFPALLIFTGIILPFDFIRKDINLFNTLKSFISNPIGSIAIISIVIPAIWHSAHRFRLACQDLGVWSNISRTILKITCYGSATLMTAFAVFNITKSLNWF